MRPASRSEPRRRPAASAFTPSSRDFDKDNVSYSADDLKTVVQITQIQVAVVAEYLKAVERRSRPAPHHAASAVQRHELTCRTTTRSRSTGAGRVGREAQPDRRSRSSCRRSCNKLDRSQAARCAARQRREATPQPSRRAATSANVLVPQRHSRLLEWIQVRDAVGCTC